MNANSSINQAVAQMETDRVRQQCMTILLVYDKNDNGIMLNKRIY